MATSKKPRKRKPSRQPMTTSNPRYLVSTSCGSGHADDDVDETWFSNVDHAIEHCLTFGPQFFLDTAEFPAAVIIIDALRADGSGANLSKMPLDIFIPAVESGLLTVHYGPWNPDRGAWCN